MRSCPTLAPRVVDPARALAPWGLGHCPTRLIAQRENRVFRVDTSDGPLALRLHRPGLRSPSQLVAELDWMATLAKGGLAVPRPIPTRQGQCLHQMDEALVSVLSWVEGQPMLAGATVADAHALGAAMADLHLISDIWGPPIGLDRPRWDAPGLLGDAPLWGRFWEAPLPSSQRALLAKARDVALALLEGYQGDFGLVHADLVPENVLLGHAGPVLLDFDDGGFGWRLFDLATCLNRLEKLGDPLPLQAALLAGYTQRRRIDLTDLPLFRALRAFTYVGWSAARLDESGSQNRLARHAETACRFARKLIEGPSA